MNREEIINSSKSDFMRFLEHDYSGQILDLFNDEGLEIFNNYPYKSERICYILVYSKYKDELLHNDKFLRLMFNTRLSSYYSTMTNLKDDTYDYIISKAIEFDMDIKSMGTLFSLFNTEYKLKVIKDWKYSKELLYEVFKQDMRELGPTIIKNYNIDLTSNGINIETFFSNLCRTFSYVELL